nr:MAG TPA: hypothetical protein [Caudoviricetes sp.]
MYYSIIKEYYDKGLYKIKQMKNLVKAKAITPEEYKKITNLDYNEPNN